MRADGSFVNKVGVLASQFKTGEILLWEAHGHLAPMYDETSRQPIWSSRTFQTTNPVLMNKNGHGVSIPTPTQPELIKQLSPYAFLRFNLTTAPTTVYEECLESRFSLKAGVAIPDILRTDAVAPPIRNVREVLKVKDLLVAIQGYTGTDLIVGTIKPPKAGSTWLECLPKYYLQCVFTVLSKQLQESFVGDVLDTTVHQDLTSCKQTIFDTALCCMANHTVTEYYEAFTSIITGSPYDETKPFPFDISKLFFAGANANLISMIHSDTKSLPVATSNGRVSAALCPLNTIKDLLIAAKGKVQVIDGQIQAMTGNQRPRTNMAIPPMVHMANPFRASQHYQTPFQSNPGSSPSSELATSTIFP
jgi:hypothetical protein